MHYVVFLHVQYQSKVWTQFRIHWVLYFNYCYTKLILKTESEAYVARVYSIGNMAHLIWPLTLTV